MNRIATAVLFLIFPFLAACATTPLNEAIKRRDFAEVQRLVRGVPGLTLTLDYTHFTRNGLPDSAVEPLLPQASHFHVRGACKGRLQTSFDKNTIDYRRVVEVLRKTGYAGCLGIEYIWIDWEHGNENDCLSETIRFRDFLRSVW